MTPKPEENDSLNKTCIRCTDAAAKTCGGCKSIRYCSPECQQADWPSHKLLCKSFKDFNQPPPSPGVVRIVVFHPDEEKPRFAWAPTRGPILEDRELLGRYGEHINYSRFTNTNAWTGEALGYHVLIRYDDNFIGNYRERNEAVLSSTQGMDTVGWCGPMTAHCRPSRDPRPDEPDMGPDMGKFIHMNLQAFSYLVGYLVDHENGTFMHAMRKRPKVNCVKVACKGDRDNGMPFHQIVRVPRSHPVFFGEGDVSQVSERISMPVLTWKCPASKSPSSNSQIDHMHISCVPDDSDDPQDEEGADVAKFGWVSKTYPGDAGTQLVASGTMQHLSIDDVAAFGDFCQWHLGPYFQTYSAEGGDRGAVTANIKPSQWVLNELTEERWTEYLVQWKAEKEDAAAAHARGTRSYTLAKASSGVERMGLTEDDSDRLRYVLPDSLEQYIDLRKLDLERLDLSDD